MPAQDRTLIARLLEFYLEAYTGQDLSGWLRDLGLDSRGTVAEKSQRIRENTQYLSMPANDFPDQTMAYLSTLPVDSLASLCEGLAVDDVGTKDALLRRIMREVRFAEGWVARPPTSGPIEWTVSAVRPFVEFYPITKRGQYEKDFYGPFSDEMSEVFGDDNVHQQLAIAYGNSLRIDFHHGHPQREGVGVEFNMPTNNGDIQKAIGRLDQYRERYNDCLILVLLADFVDKAQVRMLMDRSAAKRITLITK